MNWNSPSSLSAAHMTGVEWELGCRRSIRDVCWPSPVSSSLSLSHTHTFCLFLAQAFPVTQESRRSSWHAAQTVPPPPMTTTMGSEPKKKKNKKHKHNIQVTTQLWQDMKEAQRWINWHCSVNLKLGFHFTDGLSMLGTSNCNDDGVKIILRLALVKNLAWQEKGFTSKGATKTLHLSPHRQSEMNFNNSVLVQRVHIRLSV